VVVDCSAIPPSLIESELFGHEKGAFTGAVARRGGLFEAADGGTVFLDEIGELPLETQPVLLSVLETREVRRVGAIDTRKINVRVIAATNRDLREEVNRGIFRSDLWYRLNTLRLAIPPLRERPEDIAHLVAHFYRQFASDANAAPPLELVERMCRHRWPGNVRELRSAVERALVFSEPALWEELGAIEPMPQDPHPGDPGFPLEFSPEVSFRAAKSRIVARWESAYLAELMRQNDGNISQAARTARMDRNYLRELLARHGINIR
jgi:DNA-binding NtrC family response regulator